MKEDGVTPNISGPLLRMIIRTVAPKWSGWSPLCKTFQTVTKVQQYSSVGVQHILLPGSSRYELDMAFLSPLNVAVPSVDGILRISSCEVLPALEKAFPLTGLDVGLLGTTRSFVHHIAEAYASPLRSFTELRNQKPATGWNPAFGFAPSRDGLTAPLLYSCHLQYIQEF